MWAWEQTTRNGWALRRAGLGGQVVGLDVPGLLALPRPADLDGEAATAHLQRLEAVIVTVLAERPAAEADPGQP